MNTEHIPKREDFSSEEEFRNAILMELRTNPKIVEKIRNSGTSKRKFNAYQKQRNDDIWKRFSETGENK